MARSPECLPPERREHRAITLRAKVFPLVLLWAAIGYSALAVASTWWLRALLVAIAAGVTIHLLQLKTLTREMAKKLEAAAAGESPGGGALCDSYPI